MEEKERLVGFSPGLVETWPLRKWPAIASEVDRRLADN
jgi:hypothetical protein